MIRYSSYNRSYIVITERFNAFVYFTTKRKIPLTSFNFGKGKDHWLEYLGCFSLEACKRENPKTSIRHLLDVRYRNQVFKTTNKMILAKIKELECMYIED